MSDIDLVKHYRVGVFGTVPIYMALEDGSWIGNGKEPQPSNTVRNGGLTIGGGSGEHAALIVNDPSYCVARFLIEFDFEDNENVRNYLFKFPEMPFVYCDGYSESEWAKEFDWHYAHYADIHSFSEWAVIELGQFIYHRLSDFYPTVMSWKNHYGNLDVQRTIIHIPWDQYFGNGADLFQVKAAEQGTAANL